MTHQSEGTYTWPAPLQGEKSESIGSFLLNKKAMTNLDGILKSRDITLLTKIHIVKTMVFSVSCMEVRVGPQGNLSAKKLMFLNCGFEGNS